MKEIKAFECSFCRKIYRQKKSCEKHELKCIKNPNSTFYDSSCFRGCIHLDMIDVTVQIDNPYNYDFMNKDVSVYYCRIKNTHMIPIERKEKGSWYSPVFVDNIEELDEEFMSENCELFKI